MAGGLDVQWHTPQSLAAEAMLSSLALLIFAYRVMGGRNEWLRTHGIILVTYYAMGTVAYDELEGWPMLETTYFLTVTITTVGYGDITPSTDAGKLFTVFYSLIGIVFVFAALTPLVDALLFVKDLILKPCTPEEPEEEYDDLDVIRANSNWGYKYFSASMGPVIIFVLGLIIGFFVMDLTLIDCVYWSMITMTTIGYGDISASSWYEMAVLCLYLPTAVAALADTLGMLQRIGTAKMLIETDFAEQADKLLLGEAGGPNPNPDETLTEAEFLISVLKDNDIVDDMTVNAIRLQFAHITRHDTSKGENKVLDDKMVFLEMKAQGRIVQTSPKAPTITKSGVKIEHVDLTAADGGFAEWLERYWWPRVFDGKAVGPQIRLEPMGSQKGGKFHEDAKKKASGKEGKGSSGGGGGRSYQRLDEEKGGDPNKKSGYQTVGQMAVEDGEWVFMPKEQAARTRGGTSSFDRDAPLWFLLLFFLAYFVWKMLPDILGHHAAAATADRRALSAASSAAAGVLSDAAAAAAVRLSSLRPGDAISEDMAAELRQLLAARR